MRVLITGATSGIGLQLATDYLNDGHYVHCCGRNPATLDLLSNKYQDHSVTHAFDAANLNEVESSLQDLDKLDAIILNAGTCEYINAKQFDAEMFERVLRTNCIGIANCLQLLIPKVKPGGIIGLMGSSSSYLPLPRAEAYGASKAAIEYLSRTLQISLKSSDIHVSYIAPGFVETPLTDKNDFPMPMRVDVKFASERIRAGLAAKKQEIHFPSRFTSILKLISILPNRVQQFLIARVLT